MEKETSIFALPRDCALDEPGAQTWCPSGIVACDGRCRRARAPSGSFSRVIEPLHEAQHPEWRLA